MVLAAVLMVPLVGLCVGDEPYRVGVIPQFNHDETVATWEPVLEELARRTGLAFTLAPSTGIPQFDRQVVEGRFDFAYMNPYQFITVMDRDGYHALVRDGGRELHGILVVPTNSPIRSVEELEGKTVAFPSRRALAASLLMRADLDNLLNVHVRPVYVRSHSAVYDSVLLGYAAAGSGVLSTLRRQGPRAQQVLRVLYETRGLPPHPFAAHPRVPEADREAVRRALVAMAMTREGKALLARIPIEQAISASNDDYRPLVEWGLRRYFREEEVPSREMDEEGAGDVAGQ
ncbi:phosphate/phosphite/phosphonate ABC transporter substrate-binding protein [Endothiovibrio diazotrophicus]